MQRPPTPPVTGRLVDKQMLGRLIAARSRPGPEVSALKLHDFVCVSRAPGLEGREFGARLAAALGWQVFDREVLNLMAEGDPSRLGEFEWLDQNEISWLEDIALSIGSSKYGWNVYLHRLTETVLSIARARSAVFVGRGTDRILPRDQGLRVRIFASDASILADLSGRLGVSIHGARRELQATRERRRRWFEHHFRIDPDDPTRHDVLVNLDRYTYDEAVEIALAARAAKPQVEAVSAATSGFASVPPSSRQPR